MEGRVEVSVSKQQKIQRTQTTRNLSLVLNKPNLPVARCAIGPTHGHVKMTPPPFGECVRNQLQPSPADSNFPVALTINSPWVHRERRGLYQLHGIKFQQRGGSCLIAFSAQSATHRGKAGTLHGKRPCRCKGWRFKFLSRRTLKCTTQNGNDLRCNCVGL